MQWYTFFVGIVHLVFAFCEMFPWSNPILLSKVSAALPNVDEPSRITGNRKFTQQQNKLVTTIVHNAGIYNFILAASLIWAALYSQNSGEFTSVLFVGVIIVGAFGTATLRSPITALQAFFGVTGLILFNMSFLSGGTYF